MSNPLLEIVTEQIGDVTVSDDEYEAWKKWYETLSEHDKIFHVVGATSQYLISGCRASAAVFASAIICTNRWIEEKSLDDF